MSPHKQLAWLASVLGPVLVWEIVSGICDPLKAGVTEL